VELLLVRHGQPAWVDEDGTARNDPGLTALGRAQASAMAGALGTTTIDLLVSSTAVRARQTAAPLADLLETTPREEEDLFELRLPPEWDGAPAKEVGDWFRSARRRDRHEWWQGAPGGEDFGAFHQRVCGAILGLLDDLGVRRHSDDGNLWDVEPDDDRRVCVVGHAGTNSVVLGHLLGIEPEPWEWERFSTSHAGITTLRTTPIAGRAIWSLQGFDDTRHLPRVTD
jgi:broad specificity phosphatase PhoE